MTPVISALKTARKAGAFRRPHRVPMVVALAIGLLGVTFADSKSFAGDLLRGGAVYGKTNPVGPAPAVSAAQDQARANANDVLSKTTKAIQSVQAMQQAAQRLSSANNLGADPNHPGQILPNVPNGLVPGGLQIIGTPVGASAPRQSGRGGSVTVTVKQNASQAILNWSSFNIGKNTTLYFDQTAGGASASQWIAFNKVSDPSGVPSQILGSIRAEGQVYVINQNGIIFGGTSQVNVHTLVASSLPINDNLIARGLLNNPDAQFLFSALAQPSGAHGPTPAFTPPAPSTPGGKIGDVTVQPGAVLESPASAANVGGRIALVGANVTNAGTISTPDGQTILAAGLQVGFASHNSSDASLRGLDVFVGAVVDPASSLAPYAGTATNSGIINVQQGSAYITGKNVNQLGIISSSTSVALNGRIDLLANYNAISSLGYFQVAVPNSSPATEPFLFQSTGTVTLGPGSVTQILPDLSSSETIVPTLNNGVAGLAIPSQINLQGLAIHMAKDAVILAPNATITANAGQWHMVTNTSDGAQIYFLNSAGQIYLDSGAIIDVSGSLDVSAPISQNIIEAELRGAELADSPLQKNGALRGQSVTIDIRKTGVYNGLAWVGSPIGNLFGYAGSVQQTVGELTINGGTVNLMAGNSVVMQPGSTINVSGGWINYAGGTVTTTRVMTADGHLLDISQATPDMVYAGIYTGLFTNNHPKWGVTSTYTVPWMLGTHYDPGYSFGGNGGSVNITAPSVALDGSLIGATITSERQLTAAPLPSSLSLTFQSTDFLQSFGNLVVTPGSYTLSPTPPSVIFQTGSSLAPAEPFALDDAGNPMPLRADRVATVQLSPNLLTEDGFGSLSVDNSDGSITIPAGVALTAAPGGTISLKGSNITIGGSISAPAGNVNLTVTTISPYIAILLKSALEKDSSQLQSILADPSRGLLTLNPGATVTTAGLIIDNRRTSPTQDTLPQFVNTATTISGNTTVGSNTVTIPLNSALAVGEKVSGPGIPAGTTITGNNSTGSQTVLTLSNNATSTGAGVALSFVSPVYSTTTGGTIAINAYSANLAAGSVLNVSGGVLISPTGKLTYGNGGSLTINTGIDPNITVLGGTLNLGATLLGYSGAKGGSLSIQAQQILIGSGPAIFATGTTVDVPTAPPLVLSPDFFSEGGFTSFTLTGIGTGFTSPAIDIAVNTVIEAVAENVVGVLNAPGHSDIVLKPVVEPVGLRTPVSFKFVANGATDPILKIPLVVGNFVMEEGAAIRTDPLASVSVSAQTIAVLGTISAPGGVITLKGGSKYVVPGAAESLPTVYLGPQSVLSTAGTTVFTPNAFGQRTGYVLPGGTISVSGNIVAMAGAVLDVSGATDMLDVPPASLGLNALLNGEITSPVIPLNSGVNFTLYSREVVRTRVDSNGGIINLAGAEELFTDATLLGAAGGPTAMGGTLFISSGAFSAVTPPPSAISLVVTQNKRTIPVPFFSGGQTGIGNAVVDAQGNSIAPMGYFAANSFQNGGFDSLFLNTAAGSFGQAGNVQFPGPVSITARNTLEVAGGGFLYADSKVNLTASYVALGTPFQPPLQSVQQAAPFTFGGNPYYLPPTYGTGELTVRANYIDVGNLSLQGIGKATLIAVNGDIRGDGTLDIQGNLTLQAAQIYPSTAVNFTIAAYDYTVNGVNHPGTINVVQAGVAQLPLSAGGALNIYASVIHQGGTLVAPFGVINLGWDGTGTAPTDFLAGPYTPSTPGFGINSTTPFPVTQKVTLSRGSVTSVAGIDLNTNLALTVPYGLNLNGIQWIDPSGTDISAAGVPLKSVNIQGQNVSTAPGSVVSIEGGGDLFAYRFVPGQGGSSDILSSSSSYAVIPGYQSLLSPYAAYNQAPINTNSFLTNSGGVTLLTDQGYVNSTLSVGSQIYLAGSNTLPAGVYTLLPARYALLPGAVLVTPVSGAPIGTLELPDGSSFVSGSVLNGFSTASNQFTVRFQLSNQSVISNRADYETFQATTFFPTAQANLNVPVSRLPTDAGHLVFEGIQTMSLLGQVHAGAPSGGLGGLVDISTPQDIYITGSGTSGPAGDVVLSSSLLNSYGAESLLIGGVRTLGSGTATVNVTTGNIEVNNAGSPLSAPEIILVANKGLTLDAGATISQSGNMGEAAATLYLKDSTQLSAPGSSLSLVRGGSAITFPSGTPGDDKITSTVAGVINNPNGDTLTLAANTPTTLVPGATVTLNAGGTLAFVSGGTGGSIPISLGDGTLLRVSGDANADIVRSHVASSTQPNMIIGKGATVSGTSITLDSTYATYLDPSATLSGSTINLNSGQISLLLPDYSGPTPSTPGLVLSGSALQSLQSAQAISLLSYSSMDVYGTGQVGSSSLASLALHAGEIRGFSTGGGAAIFAAQTITLDNKAGNPGLGAVSGLDGSLVFNANVVQLGANQLNVDQYATVSINAPYGVLASRGGGFTVQGALNITTSQITASAGVTHGVTASGALVIESAGAGVRSTVTGGIGSSLTLQGASVVENTSIRLPSGLLVLHATSGDLSVGGVLDVSGTSQAFYDLIKFTDGGKISLVSDAGSVAVDLGGVLNVSANAAGGSAGTVIVQAPSAAGTVTLAGSLLGKAGKGGQSGNFVLDVGTLPALFPISTALDAGQFLQSRSIRVRNGNLTIDVPIVSHSYSLFADNGSITVNSTIDASGITGGDITLAASGSVILSSTAVLTVAGETFNSAGKGGSVTLEAGADINGTFNNAATLNIMTGSVIDLSVGNSTSATAPLGDFTGTLHLRAPQNAAGTDLQISAINGTIRNASSIVVEGYRIYDLASSGGAITTTVQNQVSKDGTTFAANTGSLGASGTMLNRLLSGNAAAANLATVTSIVPGAELINSTSGSTVLPITLNASGSAVTFDSPATLTFASGTPGGDTVNFSVGGAYTVGGVTTPFGAGALTLPAGAVVTLSGPGTLTFASGGSAIPFSVATTGSMPLITTSGGTAPTLTASSVGSAVQLNATNAALTLTAANSVVTFPNGISGNNQVRFSVAGKITTPTGVVTNFNANATFSSANIPAGSTVQLNSANGRITFSNNGTGGSILVAVAPNANFTTTGNAAVAAPTKAIVLGTSGSGTSADWDLSTFRFGTQQVPGILTMRSSGSLVFYNTLSDGFAVSGSNPGSAYNAPVMSLNALLPANAQSWSYNLTAGADLSSANVLATLQMTGTGTTGGSVLLGKNMPTTLLVNNGGTSNNNNNINGTTSNLLTIGTGVNYYDVIRTGTGDINIAAGNNVLLLNQFATIFTAGVKVSDPTLGGAFVTPILPTINSISQGALGKSQGTYPVQYTFAGGNVVISAQGDIAHETLNSAGILVDDSEAQLPSNWLYRRGYVDTSGAFGTGKSGDITSTTWWIDFSNFFEGVGALGGGNVTLNAGGNVSNVDAVIPTNARMPGKDPSTGHAIAPDAASLVELGGGDLVVKAGNNLDAGVYYVERGHGTLTAGGSIVTNSTRSPSLSAVLFTPQGGTATDSQTWLPTTLFVGQASFDVTARGSVLMGPVSNVFLLPQGYKNTFYYKTYFETYGASAGVDITSLGGSVTLRESATLPTDATAQPLLEYWIKNVLLYNSGTTTSSNSRYEPWLRLAEDNVDSFSTLMGISAPSLRATAFAGDINIVGNLTLFPSPSGTVDLAASGSINALQPNGVTTLLSNNATLLTAWSGSVINLSDADPLAAPGIASPLAYQSIAGTSIGGDVSVNSSTALATILASVNALFSETGSSTGNAGVVQTKTALHDQSILHLDDPNPVHLYAGSGDISGLTLFSGKSAQVAAGQDITDVSLYIQNVNSSDISFVSAGRDIITYDPNSPLHLAGLSSGNAVETLAYGTFIGLDQSKMAGDIQISGPGTLEVLAGRNLNLGNASSGFTDGTGVGITSIGNARNPALPFTGSDLVVAAGIGPSFGLSNSQMDFTSFLSQYLSASSPVPGSAGGTATSASGGTYLSELSATLSGSTGGGTVTLTPESVMQMSQEQQDVLGLQLLMIVLRDAGRSGDFATGNAAIATLFPKPNTVGDITVTGREIKTVNGGNLTIVNPAGQITVGLPGTTAPAADQGIFTVDGGNVGIFANGDTNVGISRIFTLHGGNIIIWSSTGNIDAGASAKTVTAAPPTRVLIDPQSADVQTDLGGLATGGGIGVLATVAGVPPGSVDLIAPIGIVDAGDAGIRATGSVNIAAAVVLNASNIAAPSVSGAPSAPSVAAPNIAGLAAASSAAGAGSASATQMNNQNANSAPPTTEEAPSIITVEVLGYGGGDEDQ